MVMRFRPAPGWPTPPERWVPPPEWRPDPSWPAAPDGWQFWQVDDAAEAKLGFLERRRAAKLREKRAQAQLAYEARLADWRAEHERLAENIEAAHDWNGAEPDEAPGFLLKQGERPYGLFPGVALIEPRATPGHYEGASRGVSFHVAKGITYRVGQSRGTYVPGPSTPTPIDNGEALLTNQRLVFRGAKATREWAFSKMVGFVHSDDDTWTALQVSNRQKTSGIFYGPDAAVAFQFRFALALATWQGDRKTLIEQLEQERDEHIASKPVPPI